MTAPGIRVYRCRDGVHLSRYPDLRDCPELPAEETGLQAGNGERTRFLGARGLLVTAEEAEALGVALPETEPPPPIDIVKLVAIGMTAALIVYLILTWRKRRVRSGG